MLHPIDGLAVESLLDGDMRHRRRRRCAVPMFLAGRKPDHIARPDFFDRTAPTLRPADACSDDERLPERMGMPGGAGPRFESDAETGRARRLGCLKKRIEADGACEIIRRSLAGRL